MDKKNPSPPETTAPLADTGSLGFCPHWNTAGQLCLLSQDGLFLPVQEHVADFCECSDYRRCPRFHIDTQGRSQCSLKYRHSPSCKTACFFRMILA